MRTSVVATIGLLVCSIILPSLALADDGPEQHKGFYLRLTTGIGYGTTGDEVKLSGAGGMTTIGIGYAIMENLIVNADIWALHAIDPTIEFDGKEAEVDGGLDISGLGIGLTYYLMPANIYVTGSLGMADATLEVDGYGEFESDSGLGVNLAVGKEWWVSDNWGLGVAGQVFFADIEDESAIAGGILFSATYN